MVAERVILIEQSSGSGERHDVQVSATSSST
jgi:hypothetical protein